MPTAATSAPRCRPDLLRPSSEGWERQSRMVRARSPGGILMSRHRKSAGAALDLLTKESQLAYRKVREIAQDLVDEVQLGRD